MHSKISLFSWVAWGLSKGMPRMMKVSARPCRQEQIGSVEAKPDATSSERQPCSWPVHFSDVLPESLRSFQSSLSSLALAGRHYAALLEVSRPACLHSNANGPVAHVGPLCSVHGVEVDVDDAVQVPGHLGCHLGQTVEVKKPAGIALMADLAEGAAAADR